jgi:hypothetical protein
MHAMYQQYLGRPAEPTAVANMLPLFASGAMTQLSLRETLLASREYCRRWLSGQYQEFLKRLPEAGAYKNWCGAIMAKRLSFDEVRTAIANSDEAVAKRGR